MPPPKLVQTGTISFREFQQRLGFAVENYAEYCKVIKADEHSNRPIDWLDHFMEFLSLEELNRRK